MSALAVQDAEEKLEKEAKKHAPGDPALDNLNEAFKKSVTKAIRRPYAMLEGFLHGRGERVYVTSVARRAMKNDILLKELEICELIVTPVAKSDKEGR